MFYVRLVLTCDYLQNIPSKNRIGEQMNPKVNRKIQTEKDKRDSFKPIEINIVKMVASIKVSKYRWRGKNNKNNIKNDRLESEPHLASFIRTQPSNHSYSINRIIPLYCIPRYV